MLNLHEIIELEKKWHDYKEKHNKKKRNIIYFIVVILAICLILLLVYYFYNKGASELQQNIQKSNQEIKHIVNDKKVELEKNKILKKNKEKNTENTYETNIIENNVSVNNDLNDVKNIKSNDTKMPSLTIQNIDAKNSTFVFSENKNQVINSSPIDNGNIVISNISKNVVEKVSNIDNLEYLLIKYNETNSIYFALEIAEIYYNKLDYMNARKWALTANKKDYNNEKSWIIFAKSSYKLGYKEQAISALNSYLNTKDSNIIRKLLDDIRKDEI
ncbi:hypothetical protein [Campylobacter sp. MG1]|uniref:hypothetical protein n=1 Tax=Campylobacter sp. MG1 TaxID=2976332 RepID=UPI00226CE4DF|nr:hypothetical protein [Campylobacter sp. MG1]